MKTPVIGIVAEYNPFHNGHAYHIESSKKIFPGAATVAVLSAHFVQRGEGAFISPISRARMAIACGADLVLELPSAFSCQQAGIFAAAAVDILVKTGVVSHISYGAEGNLFNINKILEILMQEPQPFKEKLTHWLNLGFSFVTSRAKALDELIDGAYETLKKPNNSLAVSYRLHAAIKKYPVEFIEIQRKGCDYHSVEWGALPSAKAIRKIYKENQRGTGSDADADIINKLSQAMPDAALKILFTEKENGRVVSDNARLFDYLKFTLTRSSPEELKNIWGMTEGIENKMKKEIKEEKEGKKAASAARRTYEDFIQAMTSRRYPASRIARLCIHTLLNLEGAFGRELQDNGPSWIRVLAANERGAALLKTMRKTAQLPVISRFTCPRDNYSRKILEYEKKSAWLWQSLVTGNDESQGHALMM